MSVSTVAREPKTEPFLARLGRAVSTGHRPLWIILAVGLLIGLVWGNDYGMSFDEGRNVDVGSAALGAYAGSAAYFDLGSLDEHGPVYFMFFVTTSKLVHAMAPIWTLADGRHLTNYLMFLVAVASFYVIGLRLLSKRGAWMATLLFATQPLVFGHGFINQKDTPFMGLFMATVALGLIGSEHWGSLAKPSAESEPGRGWGQELRAFALAVRSDFRRLSSLNRATVFGIFALWALVSVDLTMVGLLRGLGLRLIESAHAGHALAPIQALFDLVATDAYKTPLAYYLDKFDAGWRWIRWTVSPLAALGALGAAGLILPTSRHRLAGWLGDIRHVNWHWSLLASAVLLGLTICVRQLGVFAGALVSLIVLFRGGGRATVPLVAYWVVAIVVAVATWPYLWPDPAARFVESLTLAANFPPHQTFYRGRWLRSSKYPWYYFPNLAGIELTEPAVFLTVLGIGLAAYRFARRDHRSALIALLGIWAGVPLLALIALKMTIYGNITHLLFVLPPFLLLAGMALEAIIGRLRSGWLRVALVTGALLPGVWGIVWLHPYEYIYINTFAGGVSRADGFYELDRACISLREGIEYLNEVAPYGATVMLPPQVVQVVPYARPDLRLIDERISYDEADFVINCTWTHGLGPWPSEDFHPIFQVQRARAVLTVVYARNPGV